MRGALRGSGEISQLLVDAGTKGVRMSRKAENFEKERTRMMKRLEEYASTNNLKSAKRLVDIMFKKITVIFGEAIHILQMLDLAYAKVSHKKDFQISVLVQ